MIFKLLSEDPQNYNDAPGEAIRRILEQHTGHSIPKGTKLDGNLIEYVRMGTTVATNALLERKGKSFVYITTEGFEDVLKIGTQARPELFNLRIHKTAPLYDEVVGIEERITVETSSDDPNEVKINPNNPDIVITASTTPIRIIKPLNVKLSRERLKKLFEKGHRNLAVCFAHSYLFNDHEKVLYQLAKDIGFQHVSISSNVSKSINYLNRGNSTCIDAYLTPIVQEYVDKFLSYFNTVPKVQFMRSDGGLTDAKDFKGINAILSGPAGGVVGVKETCYTAGQAQGFNNLVGFDMGGTSTDVSRVDGENFEISVENKTAGLENSAPQLQIHTVAAGGGSVLKWENGLFHVGPESAGSHPGPASYRKGGPLTVTDANLFLGRLFINQFPKIFGKNGDESLDADIVRLKFEALAKLINSDTGKQLSPEDVALGFLGIANVKMANSIRDITESRGYATKEHTLVSFGGAGSQNCSAVARNLDISRVVIHKYSSILSAYGIARAKTNFDLSEPYNANFDEEALSTAKSKIDKLKQKVIQHLVEAQGAENIDDISIVISLGLKYKGSNTVFQVEAINGSDDYKIPFLAAHEREFGFNNKSAKILISSVNVRGIYSPSPKNSAHRSTIPSQLSLLKENGSEIADSDIVQCVVFEQGTYEYTKVYNLPKIKNGAAIFGPALIIDETQTILVEPNSKAYVLENHVVLEIDVLKDSSLGKSTNRAPINAGTPLSEADPVLLTVFGHRFMGIAETMGRTLQRTSVSSSIKERLDFSCAIFDSEARLCANAPHIPVHLGSMQFAIKYQHELHKDTLKPGDVLVSNHPEAGGTHLPDITVITPVFHNGEIVFYVASRGHHADIGGAGITAMSPNSRELWQEGVSIKSFKLVSQGHFDEEGITKLFAKVAEMPGCSATRNINHNLNDLRAQVGANKKGITLVENLFKDYGKDFVQYYMRAITFNAEMVVRDFFKKEYQKRGGKPLEAEDFFDDGTIVKLKITIDGNKGEAFFDFTGTGQETYGPMNTPVSITHSCVIYVIRCLIDLNIPLNQGCLEPCHIHIPKNTILNPSEFVAICGSTISGQRITDVILKCFGNVAASQGCANSFGWGRGGKNIYTGEVEPGFAMGEALGGGVGALEGYGGASACNVHCTNTKTTDIEVVEARAPVVVTKWEIRKGSGGAGKWYGGDGAVREIEAQVPLRVSILSERRIYAPYGVNGGDPGAKGENLWFRRQKNGDYIVTKLGAKEIILVQPFDRVQIRTPGGGGFGKADQL